MSSPDAVAMFTNESQMKVFEGLADDELARSAKAVKRALEKENVCPFSPATAKVCSRSPKAGRGKKGRFEKAGTPARAANLISGMFSTMKPKRGVTFMDNAKRQHRFSSFATQLGNNPMTALMEAELKTRIEAHTGKKKCFTAVGLSVATIRGSGELVFSDKKVVVKSTYWSSAESTEKFVGVDRTKISMVTGKATHALTDHHSERAAMMDLVERIQELVSDFEIGPNSIVIINLATSYSSCSVCADILGTKENYARMADVLQEKVADEPHVAIIHKGLESYSEASKKVGVLTGTTEVRLSTSLVTR